MSGRGPPATPARSPASTSASSRPTTGRPSPRASPTSPTTSAARPGAGAGLVRSINVTWNPTTGCDRISPGCDHCYALTLAKRLKAMGQAKYQRDGDPRTSGPGFGVTMHADTLEEPLRWRTPRKVFVNSMSDIGHARVGRAFVAQTWAVMALARRHTFQVLTKRPRRLAVLLADPGIVRQVGQAATKIIARTPHGVWRTDMTGWTPEGGID